MRSDQQPRHIKLLALFSQLVNEVVGDGIADLMTVECFLRYFDWSIQDWENQTYKSIPSVQLKVPVSLSFISIKFPFDLKVADRLIYCTAENNETMLIKPDGFQEKINGIVARFEGARAFVRFSLSTEGEKFKISIFRPSGTEQIVRVYAEGNSEKEAYNLADKLAELIRAN